MQASKSFASTTMEISPTIRSYQPSYFAKNLKLQTNEIAIIRKIGLSALGFALGVYIGVKAGELILKSSKISDKIFKCKSLVSSVSTIAHIASALLGFAGNCGVDNQFRSSSLTMCLFAMGFVVGLSNCLTDNCISIPHTLDQSSKSQSFTY